MEAKYTTPLQEASIDVRTIISAVNAARKENDKELYRVAEELLQEIASEWHSKGMLFVFLTVLSSMASDFYNAYANSIGLTYEEMLVKDYERDLN